MATVCGSALNCLSASLGDAYPNDLDRLAVGLHALTYYSRSEPCVDEAGEKLTGVRRRFGLTEFPPLVSLLRGTLRADRQADYRNLRATLAREPCPASAAATAARRHAAGQDVAPIARWRLAAARGRPRG